MQQSDLAPTTLGFKSEDILVSSAMIEIGLIILEETDERPLSRSTVERAFREMCLCALKEELHGEHGLEL